MVSQLRNTKKLRGVLLNDLKKIQNRKEAENANIKEKCHLVVHILGWNDSNSCYSFATAHEVLEALELNQNLKHLYIRGCKGYICPN